MKKRFFVLTIFVCVFFSLQAQQQESNEVFYYYQGEKIFLTERTDKIFLKLVKNANKTNMLALIRSDSIVKLSEDVKQGESLPDFLIFEVRESKTDNKISVSKTEQYKANANVISVSPLLQYNKSLQGLTDEFAVKLKEDTSFKQLQELLSEYHCVIVEENEFVENQFLLSVTKTSTLNALQLANLFYETGLFEFSEPNFILLNAFQSNDTYFGNQWSLKNTGQNGGTSGIDIKAEQAWAITQGSSNIKIAVVDQGIDLTHPDLAANLLSGYDASGNNSGGAPVWSTDNHGTPCAGIVGAIKDNGKGISGVAPNCKIIPIHASNSSGGLPVDWSANAIQWAWQNGADVISNSWGGSSPYSPLTNAINTAVTQGRNGKGCVVVFASGNAIPYTDVVYPANIDGVIAVGAINKNGTVWNYSCRGDALDVVAPSGDINLNGDVYTTDRMESNGYNSGNYMSNFGGTSAACPHVAGIAALILSVRPDLTQAQVRQAIESTCTKLSGYSFSSNSNHPNGTWNSEVGHGLVNAYAALNSVAPNISGPSTVCYSGSAFSINSLPSGATVQWSVTGNSFSLSNQTNSSVTVTRIITGNNSSAQLRAVINIGNMRDTLRKTITPCIPSIIGNISCNTGGGLFTVTNIPSDLASQAVWTCSSNLQIIGNSTGITKSLKLTTLNDYNAWIKVSINSQVIAERTVSYYNIGQSAHISGSGTLTLNSMQKYVLETFTDPIVVEEENVENICYEVSWSCSSNLELYPVLTSYSMSYEEPEEPEEPEVEITRPVNVKALGLGLGWISADITVNGITKSITKDILVKNPPAPVMSVNLNHYSVVGEQDIYLTAVTSPAANIYEWKFDHHLPISKQTTLITHCPEVVLTYRPNKTPELHIVTVEASDSVTGISGTDSYSVYGSYTLDIFCNDLMLASYPNPVSDILNVEITAKVPETQSARSLSSAANRSYDISLYTIVGNLVYRTAGGTGKTVINVSELPDGIYILRIYDGLTKPVTRQIIVKH